MFQVTQPEQIIFHMISTQIHLKHDFSPNADTELDRVLRTQKFVTTFGFPQLATETGLNEVV